MRIEQHISLRPFNTFGMEITAGSYLKLESKNQLPSIFKDKTIKHLVLGGGSNILFTKDYDGLVIHNHLKGITKTSEDKNYVTVTVGAGENWHSFVLHCLENNWFGIENLSLIPGTVGASPIQNIGAYGVEIKDVLKEVTYYSIPDNKFKTLKAEDCNLGYRNSIFKKELKNTFVITEVTFNLLKKFNPSITYGAISAVLEEKGIVSPTAKDVSNAVIEIRESKLPNPKEIGNAGSFFKNPVISVDQFNEVKQRFPQVVSYPVDATHVKIPAGWLIDQAGWKGTKRGEIGVHDRQALVLVNRGKGNGNDIKDLAYEIIADIKSTYGIELTPEVNIF